ncbi:chemotaxis-specific protein-glutamate methyltransferase CheB [Geobacter pelophilus]|uniref:Protein-glutamate methylesterase/protein-glutamine glutaminase n=1 Tax=Geoanaerobacter pelophilus TaxID=60036 RepID=A0AAW4LAB2_9BACT|nr:chemotaxis-specific protein-glutamate methyltransferase CheB [Geoanaerobacter pelophilus]MBT0665271.1 chemotaxis-specific protein-glutamate methyltransferase CheB [Geoanaerobacter pelophilus]
MGGSEGAIRVLVVDDCEPIREMIRAILSAEPDIVVVGEAADGADAVAKASLLKPDIVTMDIEMPVMGGLEAIKRIMAQNPLPILVITSLTDVRTAFDAVSNGALDVIEKPNMSPESAQDLVKRLRRLSRVDVPKHLSVMGRRPHKHAESEKAPLPPVTKGSIIAIAASTGGPQAINSILSQLPATLPVPIIIAQHIAEGFTQGMADWLNSGTPLKVAVACNGDILKNGNVYLNPAEHSMRITESGMILLSDRDRQQIYNPSCDIPLASVASAYRGRCVGLILSGMGDDGAKGMQAIKKSGGVTLAQDEKSSVVYGMNRCAVELGCIDKILQLDDIPAELLLRVGGRQ